MFTFAATPLSITGPQYSLNPLQPGEHSRPLPGGAHAVQKKKKARLWRDAGFSAEEGTMDQ